MLTLCSSGFRVHSTLCLEGCEEHTAKVFAYVRGQSLVECGKRALYCNAALSYSAAVCPSFHSVYEHVEYVSMVTMIKLGKHMIMTILETFQHPVVHLQVKSGSTPITPTPAGTLVTHQARLAGGPPSKHTPTPSPLTEPSATPLADPQAITPGTTPSHSIARTPPFSTPPPRRASPQGSLVSEHRERRSASAKKPPLHPHASPNQTLTPLAQAGSAAKLSSTSTSTQTPAGDSLLISTRLSASAADSSSQQQLLTAKSLCAPAAHYKQQVCS